MFFRMPAQLPLLALSATLCLAGGTAVAEPVEKTPAGRAAASVPAPHATLALMERVADWQLAHPSTYPSDDWTVAVGTTGFMALSGVSGQDKYRAAMQAIGERTRWRLGPSKFHADDQAIGQMYAELYLQMRDPRMIAPMRAQFDEMLAEPRPGSMNWNAVDVLHRWSWCDTLFMAPPAWARLSAATGDPRYLEFAIRQWWITSDYLYDKEEHLFYRDSRYFDMKEANGGKVFWGRGNGWVMGGLVRMLQYIPDNHPDRPRFLQQYREMAERVLGLQQPDGLWRASLLDPKNYPNRESSGSGLYAYALAWGVNQGVLPRERFGPAVGRAWQALSANVQADGKLVHVQPLGIDPRIFPADSTDIFGVGAFLLAGSEVYRMGLVDGKAPRVVTVSNGSGLRRPEESIELAGALGEVAVMDAQTSRLLPAQAIEGGLLFQSDLAPGETRRFLLLPRSAVTATPPVAPRAHARFVPERLDDFAWENDRVAFRTYGPAVLKDPRERLRSSGIDIWSKSTRKLVLDAWYRGGAYHVDSGEGLDYYHVGPSRGCGGLGIVEGKTLHTSSNFSSWKVIADGPLRAVFELHYDGWDVAGRQVAEVRRVSLDAGSNFSRVESRFSSPSPAPLTVGVGIARRTGDGHVLDANKLLSYWEPAQGANGSNACAVILPKANATLADDGHFMLLGAARPQQAFVYYLGSAWSKGGDFADAKAWEAHVVNEAARLAAPVKISISG